MGALSGSLGERTRAVLAAGCCDVVLHCDGNMVEMEAVAAAAPVLEGEAAGRAAAALAKRQRPAPIDLAQKRTEFGALLKSVWEPAQGWA
jgi:beta-N-acetylhexosaminidase